MAVNWNKPPEQRPVLRREPRVLVSRHCLVCEWEGDVVQRPGEDPDCPWCHGPTEPRAAGPAAVEQAEAAKGSGKNPHAAALGRLGGVKGGRARAEALTPTQRRRIASRAARARWAKKREKE